MYILALIKFINLKNLNFTSSPVLENSDTFSSNTIISLFILFYYRKLVTNADNKHDTILQLKSSKRTFIFHFLFANVQPKQIDF